MVFVAVADVIERLRIHPQRSPVEIAFDVVDREPVADGEIIDEATLDEAREVLARAGVDEGGTGDDKYLVSRIAPGIRSIVDSEGRSEEIPPCVSSLGSATSTRYRPAALG